MSDDTMIAADVSTGLDDPETHACDAVEAMRARGTDRPDIERAILAAGQGHARVLETIRGEAEPPR